MKRLDEKRVNELVEQVRTIASRPLDSDDASGLEDEIAWMVIQAIAEGGVGK